MRKRVLSIIVSFILLMLALTGCGHSKTNNNPLPSETGTVEGTQEITINLPPIFISMVGMTQDELYESFSTLEHFKFENVSKNEDGSISVTGTESQFDQYIDFAAQRLQQTKDDFAELSDKYKIVVNDTYTEVDYYFDRNISMIDSASFFLLGADDTAYMQLFTRQNTGEDFELKLNIYNCDTGKLVASHDVYHMDGELFTDEEWEKSYE